MGAKPSETQYAEVEGRQVKLTQLDKVWFPETGTTKGEVLAYYAKLAPTILPHYRDRPVTLKRYPHGAEGEFFFEKNAPRGTPEWVKTFARKHETRRGITHYAVVNDLPTLMWTVNLSSIELHIPLSKIDDIDRPDLVAFDLDPGEGMTIVECCEVGKLVHRKLQKLGLRCFPKTSGSKGLQVYVPVSGRNGGKITYEHTRGFAHELAIELEREHRDLIVSNMRKEHRKGKIFIDWSQNTSKKTTVAVYAVRARSHPTVSTPVTWNEVRATAKNGDPATLTFEIDDVVERVARKGDLFKPTLNLKQKLPV